MPVELPSNFDADAYERLFPAGIERDFWHGARCAMVEAALRRNGLAQGRVLDVGCGRGIMLAHLRKVGLDVLGCEPSSLAPVPEELLPFVTKEARVEELPAELRASVRTAMLLDVLEHLERPAELLRSIAGVLPSMEAMVVTVPARMELWTAYDASIGHWRRYDLPLLREHLAEGGFETIEAGYVFHGLYAALRLLRRFGQSRSQRFHAPKSRLALGLHALVGRAFLLERQLVPSQVVGSSILAVARPRR